MNHPVRLVTIISLLEIGAVLALYGFGVALASVATPPSLFAEVMGDYGLFFLAVPLVTATTCAVLMACGMQKYNKYAIAGILLAGLVVMHAVYIRIEAVSGFRL